MGANFQNRSAIHEHSKKDRKNETQHKLNYFHPEGELF